MASPDMLKPEKEILRKNWLTSLLFWVMNKVQIEVFKVATEFIVESIHQNMVQNFRNVHYSVF